MSLFVSGKKWPFFGNAGEAFAGWADRFISVIKKLVMKMLMERQQIRFGAKSPSAT
jgi:hypothetical protein